MSISTTDFISYLSEKVFSKFSSICIKSIEQVLAISLSFSQSQIKTEYFSKSLSSEKFLKILICSTHFCIFSLHKIYLKHS